MPKSSKNNSTPQSDWNYEETVAQVEAIINQMEAGDMDLAEVFNQFTRAVEYLKECESFLAHKRSQMDLMIETLSEDPDF
ncbi:MULTISPECIES: exodeoxyribonuclease VII small subunit [Roseofilum]|uniref:Exodeoxyribonuclease 7 small subunit n=1 Tax=Roseofilum reptotaenium AO1-A TaxID=1925591 RepID=A0A1L9QW86_9CYAN|nr:MULTISPECIES: exodeoxyribonuclease VII small subunit [Roseofilum]OJJ26899.1 exodeoxyribonuclease VII small subunit [Roseofilum reptotaenium AO1-A]HBQ98906.1 exodeoxyribonuclease VII small subunit [Cyanobacteria bacterium UBA11691]MBP0010428.1 exodeoxyribonuclease VII small subunit [Roseofilum sp. Belize Diploria]MBP0013373.1 exodeoxyribonuclease VII small subunit [Roseofilum sp. SID3]MBP0024174.1 exodeoxyribonuclease VII small subunit [Roseofilum sp. SID2]